MLIITFSTSRHIVNAWIIICLYLQKSSTSWPRFSSPYALLVASTLAFAHVISADPKLGYYDYDPYDDLHHNAVVPVKKVVDYYVSFLVLHVVCW